MADDLVFMMGKFAAKIPVDRRYSDNHLWLKEEGDAFRVGFTAYSVRLLQDVYFLQWCIEPNTAVRRRTEIGEIESSKALSTLYAPCDGTILDFNEALLGDPSLINVDNYGGGWLYRLRTDARASLLDAAAYVNVLTDGWEETQRHLKGQIN
jgi:glycine cleavage system H protein